ncbi:dipeptide ABC transporter, permease protein DppC domain protein [Fusobacterium necrophorum subsp. funduliforme ATCC 51357]|nr:ABC transporter permease subunit [Fusobacterium necrophorum]EIJ72246.1 dipeptide ABC transporter, permease protein DppC domain protein [Fusobacterium necrophorum subsp. funduliforme ATCC 51357]KAB0553844.1 ABC transporter permease subunit [Fusobacterium necrophorum subsp. funduliforme]
MYKYVLRRLLLLIPVLLGISLLVFAIMYVTPGDPAQLMLGENAPKAAVEALREKMGLNDPFIVQYFRFVGRAVTGDFGRSYTTGREVFAEIFSRFPNTLAPVIVQGTLGVANAILSIAGLSFIGLGIQPPAPEWGSMLSGGRQYLRYAWWVTTFPGLAIMITILSLNLLGDGLRDALDPRLKQ